MNDQRNTAQEAADRIRAARAAAGTLGKPRPTDADLSPEWQALADSLGGAS